MNKIYSVKVYCHNCYYDKEAECRFGSEVRKNPCPECGVKGKMYANKHSSSDIIVSEGSY